MPPASTSQQPKARQASFIFICITVALDMLAIGIIIPVLPKLIEQFMGGNTARAAEMAGLFATLFAVIQFFVSPILGALSDRFGRRPVVLGSNLGLGLDYVFMALAPSLWWLLVGRIIAGVTSASVATANAYIADVTEPEKRAQKFGMLGAAFSFGFVLGPVVGGILGSHDLRYPFVAAACMSLLNFTYGFFVLPESHKPENRTPFAWKNANPLRALRLLASHRELWAFGTAVFLSQLAHTSLPAIFVLYAGLRYGWGPSDVGLLLAVIAVGTTLVQGGLVRPAVKRLGERKAALLGLLCGAVGLTWYGFSSTGWMVWLGVPVAALWALFGAASQAIMTSRVAVTEQGQLQGAHGSILAAANILGPSLFAFTFAFGIDPSHATQLPGLGFWLAGGVLFAAAALTWRVTRPSGMRAAENPAGA